MTLCVLLSSIRAQLQCTCMAAPSVLLVYMKLIVVCRPCACIPSVRAQIRVFKDIADDLKCVIPHAYDMDITMHAVQHSSHGYTTGYQ
eukprot:2918096-Pleurochrysis_carterae.AAC.1